MGYVRGIVHGAVIGTIAGICIAPQQGAKTRAQLQGFADTAQRTAQSLQRTARRMAPQVQDAARTAVDAAGKVANRDGKHGSEYTGSVTVSKESQN